MPPITPKKFLKDYLQSPNYKKRLAMQGYKNIPQVIEDRNTRLDNTQVVAGKRGSFFSQTTGDIQYDPLEANKHNFTKEGVLAHEFSHAAGAIGFEGMLGVNNLTLNSKEIKTISAKNKNGELHDAMAQEAKADMDAFRFKLKKDGLYDTGTQEFNQDILDKAKKKYKSDGDLKRFFKTFKDGDAIQLMNTIASVPTEGEDDKQIAKFGGMITRKKKVRSLDKLAFGTGFSAVGKVPTPAGFVGEVASNYLAQQAMNGLGYLLGPHDKSGTVDDAIVDNTGGNLVMGFGGLVDDEPTKPKKGTVKPRAPQPDITLPNWDGLVQKEDGSIGMWGNDLIQSLPTITHPVELPDAHIDHNGRQSGSYYQGTPVVRDKIFEMEKKLKAAGNQNRMAYGGTAGGVPVEVEGNEVAQLPTGDMMHFSGPSHEAGGIDATLPVGTTVYSDRISVDGKTMQERKKARESKLKKLSKYLDSNPSDMINRQTLERSRRPIDLEEEHDLMVQESFNASQAKLAGGTGKAGIIPYPSAYMGAPDFDAAALEALKPATAFNPAANLAISEDTLLNEMFVKPKMADLDTSMGLTNGDLTGMIANSFGGIAPLATTIANRAGDKPNINAYKNFGTDALAANNTAKNYVGAMRDSALEDVQLQENAARHRSRNSATSVGTLRALDFAVDAGSAKAEGDIYNTFSQQMMGLYGHQSQLENQQDQVVMGGEQRRDEADRADRDNFYSNLGQNLTNLSTTTQKTAKDLNEAKQRDAMLALMPELSKYGLGYTYDENGNPVLTQIKR